MSSVDTSADTLVDGGGAATTQAAPSERLPVLREAALVVGLWLVYNAGDSWPRATPGAPTPMR